MGSGAAASVHIQGGVNRQTGLTLEIFGGLGTPFLNAPPSIQFGSHHLQGAGSADQEHQELTYYWAQDSLKDDTDLY